MVQSFRDARGRMFVEPERFRKGSTEYPQSSYVSRMSETSVEAIRLGEARYRAGAWAEAAAIFSRIAEAEPAHSAALRLLGLCRLRLRCV